MTRKKSWARAQDVEGIVKSLEEAKEGSLAIYLSRVSGTSQEAQLEDQTDLLFLTTAHKKFGYVNHYEEINEGWDVSWLVEIVQEAKESGAVLIAESFDRVLRYWNFHNERQGKPTTRELVKLKRTLQGVEVFTVLPPETPYSEVMAYQQNRKRLLGKELKKRGKQKSNPPGHKLYLRRMFKPKVLFLYHIARWSYRRLSAHTGIPVSTIEGWIQESVAHGNRIFFE